MTHRRVGDLIVRGTAHVSSTTTYLEDLDCSPLSYLTVSENDNNCSHPMCMGNADGTIRMFPTFLSFPYGPRLRWPLSLGYRCRDAHGMSFCACAVCVCSDPAWPARLLTRVYMVREHLRGQIHPRSIVNYSYSTTEKRKWRTLQWMRAGALV